MAPQAGHRFEVAGISRVQRGEYDATNSAVQILEGMNPLEAPVGPGNYISGLLLLCP
jgi:hypothetical protein